MKSKIWAWAVLAALAGFLFGFDTIVINGAEEELQNLWKNYKLLGNNNLFHGIVVVGSALWGTVIGAMFGGIPNDKIGRKNTLIIIGILYFVSAMGSAVISNPWLFAFFRFIGGLGVGASTIAAPAFISEIAPKDKRGRLVALYQFNIVFGILIAFVSNFFIFKWVSVETWRWMIGIEAVPAFIYTILAFRVPKSPRWLILKKGDISGATKIFSQIYPKEQVKKQIAAIQQSMNETPAERDKLFSPKYKIPLFLAFSIAFFNQFSGINALLYYARRIFTAAGLEEKSVFLSTVGVGITNFIFTLLGVMLIDKLGRKQLMLVGSIGYVVSLSITSLSFFMEWVGPVVPISLFLFIAAHAIGQGTVIWVFISEVFPNHLRSKGQAFGTSVHWWLAALIPASTPFLFDTLGVGFVFAIFASFMVLQLFFVLFIMPETSGISLEDLQKNFYTKKAS